LQDHDGTPFRHTYFYPAEQYHRPWIEMLAGLEADGLGEVEIHLRHGVERPDSADRMRRPLVEFRDLLAKEHNCLSREDSDPRPRYAFVHGNLALAKLRFWSDAIESADHGGKFKIHFATAREAFNIVMAAVDGRDGDPSAYRDYRLHPIRKNLG